MNDGHVNPRSQAVPEPGRGLVAYLCPERWPAPLEFPGKCDARFIFRSSYEKHWLEEHAALHEHRPVWERAAAEMGLVPDEHGFINLTDAVLPPDRSGAVFIEDAAVGAQYTIPNVGICKHPECIERNEAHLSPGVQFETDTRPAFTERKDT